MALESIPIERRLLRQNITYSMAKKEETNILHELGYWSQQNAFFDYIHEHRSLLAEVVAHHLGIHSSVCQVADMSDWLHGSFNLCVPVFVENSSRVLVRFPLPYRVGDNFRPGNSDEKVRSEAGTYAWLQEECPVVKTPRLYGFALSTGKVFTALDCLPVYARLVQHLRRWVLSLFRYPMPSRFVPHKRDTIKTIGPYLLLEYAEDGEMLSNTWNEKRTDRRLRSNLFRDLSRIMLSLSRIALPKIGSFTLDDNGFLHLVNRPLTQEIQSLENEFIPVDMSRNQPFFSVDSYVNSLLSYHDNRLEHQPNAINDSGDCASQMTALVFMRAVRSHFFRSNLNHGPFVFSLTDLHASNIFVDNDWNIKYIIDLEWAASLPLEFMQPPHWLSDQAIDRIDKDAYNMLREEFMNIFESEEEKQPAIYDLRRTDVMRAGWELGTFWYTLALQSPTGFHSLFYKRIQPRYSDTHGDDVKVFLIICRYWMRHPSAFIRTKLDDRKMYDEKLHSEFHDSS